MSSLTSTNVKLDSEKLELAKMKGCNVSQLCRDAIDSYLRLTGDNRDMLKDQLVEIEKQIKTLNLEKKIILNQLESMESAEALENQREMTFQKWKRNLSFMIDHGTIEWETQKELFKFKDADECKKWIIRKLKDEKDIAKIVIKN